MLAFSGGKDAAWALHALRRVAEIDVVGLLTTVTSDYGRVSMQGIRREVLLAQAEAIGLPVIESRIEAGADNAAYEAAFARSLDQAAARWPGTRHIAFGDLLLADVRDWRAALCERLGWQALFPLFGRDTDALAREMIAGGLEARLCCVDSTQLEAGFVGRDFDAALLEALPAGVDPCGENGEFHTCVADGPMFARPLALERGDSVLREERFLYADFLLAGDNTPR